MSIETDKIKIMKLILETDNPKTLESIKNYLAKEQKVDFWDTLTMEQKKEIELGIFEIEKGESVDYEAVIKKHRR